MNKKYYLLTMLFLGGVVTDAQADAKSAASHSKSVPSVAQNQSNDTLTSNTQDEPIFRPKISQIRFSGNTAISSEVLKQEVPLKVQDTANENVIMDSMVKIAQLYKAKNIKVTITPVLEKASINSTSIQFDIHEMPMDKK